MRRLPRNKTSKHKLIIKATDDFFGSGCLPENKRLKKDVCLWLMNRKKGVKLNDEQRDAVWHIRTNIADPTYRESLLL